MQNLSSTVSFERIKRTLIPQQKPKSPPDFIRVRWVSGNAEFEAPNKFLKNALKTSDEDEKNGRIISFNTGNVLDYLDREIEHEKRSKQSSD